MSEETIRNEEKTSGPFRVSRRQAMALIGTTLGATILQTSLPAEGVAPDSFAIGDKTFLLNGKPFVIRAAELHYPRIPRDYWEHRILMCKAMGMNTICLYIFWNLHEPRPDKFDFSGQNDVVAFCKLAQKHGLYIILRPGPYVCAEWEMGGLPWWLLKKKDIRLRSQDEYFVERCRVFLNAVGKELAPFQISRGGNLLMVQVENEYSSYAEDKDYVRQVQKLVLGAGFTDVPLFQCDWSSNFLKNALDDLLWTMNFGAGASIPEQFKELQTRRPNSPLMCSEYWSGWFDHWGRPHETRSVESLVDGLRDMMEHKISFSLYMAHGGTTFGHWGGANSPSYSAMCSSYDYDAPISEAGWVTPKFWAVRELLAKHLHDGETLPEAPKPFPIITIPEFTLRESASLWDNLPKPKTSEHVQPIEAFDEGYGSVLYRTKLSPSSSERILTVTDAHDWAQVFVDGKRVGVFDRRRSEKTVKLPPVAKEAILDILVEAMGRVNFGTAIHDHKGITEKVEITEGTTSRELTGWQVYHFPAESPLPHLKYLSTATQGPAYHQGEFDLKATGDTFLDMRTWGKGLVWLNGHALGRFWKIGPQQTLFVPGCWLKQGKNTIVVLDIDSPEQKTIAGLDRPILDQLRPDRSLLHREPGQTLDLSAEKPVLVGQFPAGNAWQEIKFDAPVKGRYFCLEALSSQGGDPYASVAELYVLGTDGKPLSREKWSIAYADSEEVSGENSSALNVFDLQESTFWHTEWSGAKPAHPHHLVIDLGQVETLTGFRYLPRPQPNYPGIIKDYRVYVREGEFRY